MPWACRCDAFLLGEASSVDGWGTVEWELQNFESRVNAHICCNLELHDAREMRWVGRRFRHQAESFCADRANYFPLTSLLESSMRFHNNEVSDRMRPCRIKTWSELSWSSILLPEPWDCYSKWEGANGLDPNEILIDGMSKDLLWITLKMWFETFTNQIRFLVDSLLQWLWVRCIW